uniref:Parathyroid hormone 2 receptor n=1 Tax=Naja naja TaxID=35670 RepID=A0A8C6VSH5_NAJNA
MWFLNEILQAVPWLLFKATFFHFSAGEECFPEWDGLICWPRGSAGKTLAMPCPSYIYDFNHQGMAFRHCNSNATWAYIHSLNRTWSNYSECLHFLQTEISLKFFERLSVMYTVGYSISFSSLAVAIFIIGYFRRLHCTRNRIHLHLFASFMLRATSIFIKDKVVHPHFGDKDFDSLLTSDLQNIIQTPVTDISQYVWCKITVVMFIYFLATNYYWILVEGLYLHSLIFVAFFSETKYLWGFILIGWGKIHCFSFKNWFSLKLRQYCIYSKFNSLERYLNAGNIKWIYQTPILVAIGLNFVLFLNTVRVLATKIWETNAVGYDVKKQYRKLAKSTLILILVFGVHYIIFVCLPHTFTGLGWEIRMHCELFFNSFQVWWHGTTFSFMNTQMFSYKTWATLPYCLLQGKRYLMKRNGMFQNSMGASSRMRVVSSKACRNGPGQNDAHINLPGYVRSNSEHDCMPQWAQEEADEEEKRLDGISLNKPSRRILILFTKIVV